MGTNREPRFLGDRLRIGRCLVGMTQRALAEAVAISPAFVSRVEKGENVPSDEIIAAFCDVLRVKHEYFCRDVADEFRREECSFRHLQSTPIRILDLAAARGTLVQDFLQLAGEYCDLPAVDIPNLPTGSIESAAADCRKHWNLGSGPIMNMTRVVERAGVVVTELEGVADKLDAFSRFGSPPAIVLMSTRKNASRRRMSIAHELGHLVRHRGLKTGDKTTESDANMFAASFLMPADSFGGEFIALPRKDVAGFLSLKRRWRVSVKAIIYRAHQLGIMNTAQYRKQMKYYNWKGWQAIERSEPQPESPELLVGALRVLEEELNGLESALHALGWTKPLAQEILPVPVLDDPPDNVTLLNSARKRQ